jgi:hypothetical protein
VELIGAILMIVVGGGIAVIVMIAIGIAQQNDVGRTEANTAADQGQIAASIFFQLLLLGGTRPDEALADIRKRAGLASPPATAGIDITSWGERFARLATPEQRAWLLETAVQLVSTPGKAVPLRQYASLLDLSFALGFQTDALAKLREQYGFDYVDHAKAGRPREADRVGGATPLFLREPADPASLLRILGMEGKVTRQDIISAYRKLAAQHHPDRVFGQAEAVQSEAAARFIEITRAYERLMAIYRD